MNAASPCGLWVEVDKCLKAEFTTFSCFYSTSIVHNRDTPPLNTSGPVSLLVF